MIREIAKGHDGWYHQHEKIDPTEEEIKAWEDKFCDYCGMGSLFPKRGNLAEQCERQIPCPACMGTGYKDHKQFFQTASGGKVVSVSKPTLNPESFCVGQRMTVEFDLNEPGQDGRPLHHLYATHLKVLHIGKTIVMAMEQK